MLEVSPRSQARGRWHQPPAQVSYEVSFEATQRRVAQLEGALRALGDARGPEVTVPPGVSEGCKTCSTGSSCHRYSLLNARQFVEKTVGHSLRGANHVGEAVGGRQATSPETPTGSPVASTSTLATGLGSTGCESATDGQFSAVGAGRSCGADSGPRRQTCRRTELLSDDARNKESAHDGPRRAFPVAGGQTGGFKGRFCQEGRCCVLELTSRWHKVSSRWFS